MLTSVFLFRHLFRVKHPVFVTLYTLQLDMHLVVDHHTTLGHHSVLLAQVTTVLLGLQSCKTGVPCLEHQRMVLINTRLVQRVVVTLVNKWGILGYLQVAFFLKNVLKLYVVLQFALWDACFIGFDSLNNLFSDPNQPRDQWKVNENR